MNCHNPLALAAVPPLQFHLAGLLQGMEAAGFTVPNAGGKGGRGAGQGLHWGQAYPGVRKWAAEWRQWGGHGCGEGIFSGKTHCALGRPSGVAALAGQTPMSLSRCHCPSSPGCPHQHEGCREERTWWDRGQAGGSLPQP